MSYCFERESTVAENVRRIAHEQIDEARTRLTATDDPDVAVHDVRKCLKKLRALVRLVRDEVGEDVYKRENACFRDAGRQLSGVRDAYVLVETMEHLLPHAAAPEAVAPIHDWLTEQYETLAAEHHDEDAQARATVDEALIAARERVDDWPIDTAGFEALRPGLHRVYRRGYARKADAEAHPSAERLHEWRKRVKYLWYHLRLLTPIAPDVLSPLVNDLDQLQEALGNDHDLAVLRKTLLDADNLPGHVAAYEALLLLINERRAALQNEARALGERIYAAPPDPFIERVEGYWTDWEASPESAAPSMVEA
ncbi:MAG: CHAD domain-containing protein [Bacteroidetes bacterium]|jgi:CHAD domain-containing protein|nr:CHAD domain-containing protein [Bacteroidota bacterium]